METIKSVGRSGQISLGKKHAGRTVLIDQIDPNVWIIKLGKFIPESEQWLYQTKIQNEINEAITWSEKNPPRKSDLRALTSRLKK
ncbi:MAG: hypothetical protein A2Y79_01505 [Deltaproteobacteria bacterium RBG_13_43_22]|nr:MAG: hypothetical protein A2Y79_01505 [Deltaproteobacteria bacterium RBG_13_43_22]